MVSVTPRALQVVGQCSLLVPWSASVCWGECSHRAVVALRVPLASPVPPGRGPSPHPGGLPPPHWVLSVGGLANPGLDSQCH